MMRPPRPFSGGGEGVLRASGTGSDCAVGKAGVEYPREREKGLQTVNETLGVKPRGDRASAPLFRFEPPI